jgi:hypothetical protein
LGRHGGASRFALTRSTGSEQRHITVDDILRAAETAEEINNTPVAGSVLLNKLAMPVLRQAEDAFSAALARITVEDLVYSAAALRKSAGPTAS